MTAPRSEIHGSAPKAAGTVLGPADPNQPVIVTVLLRRAPSSPDVGNELLAGTFQPVSREQAAAVMAPDPADTAAVRAFLEECGLKIVEANPVARSLRAEGTVQEMEAAFGVQLTKFRAPDGSEFLSHQGPISVPADLSGIVVAVLGLDQRRIAEPR